MSPVVLAAAGLWAWYGNRTNILANFRRRWSDTAGLQLRHLCSYRPDTRTDHHRGRYRCSHSMRPAVSGEFIPLSRLIGRPGEVSRP